MKYHRYNKKTARKRFPNKQRMKVIAGCTALCIALLGESCLPVSAAQNKKDLKTRVLERAEHSAYGAYPETVTYTLGKIAGTKNSNLPVGDTYENNANTRYLKKLLPAALHMVSVLLAIPSRLRLSIKPSRMVLLHDGSWSDARFWPAVMLDSIVPWRYFPNILTVCERRADMELPALA